MTYRIENNDGSYTVIMYLNGHAYRSEWIYTSRRAAVRGAFRAGGRVEIISGKA